MGARHPIVRHARAKCISVADWKRPASRVTVRAFDQRHSRHAIAKTMTKHAYLGSNMEWGMNHTIFDGLPAHKA
jgi:hypothetical protein